MGLPLIKQMRPQPQGAALLLALLLVVFVSVLSTLMMEKLYRSLRLTTVMLTTEKKLSTLLSLERLGEYKILEMNLKKSPENWVGTIYHLDQSFALATESQAKIVDLQALFNVVNLVYDKPPDLRYLKSLQTLLQSVAASPQGVGLLEKNQIVLLSMNIKKALESIVSLFPSTGPQEAVPIVLPSLETLLSGLNLSSDLIQLLKKWLIILPLTHQPTLVNVHHAPAYLLESLLGISPAMVQALQTSPDNVLMNHPLMKNNANLIGTKSTFFEVQASVHGGEELGMRTVFWAKSPELCQRLYRRMDE